MDWFKEIPPMQVGRVCIHTYRFDYIQVLLRNRTLKPKHKPISGKLFLEDRFVQAIIIGYIREYEFRDRLLEKTKICYEHPSFSERFIIFPFDI